MKRDNAITLLKSVSKESCKKLKECRNSRIRIRLRESKGMGLGFRFMGELVNQHGNMKKKLSSRYTSSAKCQICNQDISSCSCKIEVHDQNNNLIRTI